MPSPFPGMDPYLEAPGIWPDLHERLANEISRSLNQELPAPYYAKLEVRLETGIVEEGEARHQFVEIRDGTRNHKLVALIEIASPSNKRPGDDRAAYQRKQAEVLASDASLIELDLLRSGQRLLPAAKLAEYVAEVHPRPDYLVTVSPAWLRAGEGLGYHLYPVGLRDPLPCLPVPLREGDAEVLLDLQYAFNQAYDGGPYRRGAVDYAEPAEPPLSDKDTTWARRLLRQQGLASGKPARGRKKGRSGK